MVEEEEGEKEERLPPHLLQPNRTSLFAGAEDLGRIHRDPESMMLEQLEDLLQEVGRRRARPRRRVVEDAGESPLVLAVDAGVSVSFSILFAS